MVARAAAAWTKLGAPRMRDAFVMGALLGGKFGIAQAFFAPLRLVVIAELEYLSYQGRL